MIGLARVCASAPGGSGFGIRSSVRDDAGLASFTLPSKLGIAKGHLPQRVHVPLLYILAPERSSYTNGSFRAPVKSTWTPRVL